MSAIANRDQSFAILEGLCEGYPQTRDFHEASLRRDKSGISRLNGEVDVRDLDLDQKSPKLEIFDVVNIANGRYYHACVPEIPELAPCQKKYPALFLTQAPS